MLHIAAANQTVGAGLRIIPTDTPEAKFEWAAVGDSWTSGVAYSQETVHNQTDFSFCYRTNQAWAARMEADKLWTIDPQNFHFAGCGGTLMDEIPRQMNLTGSSQLVMGTLGGNNAYFGDIPRACIYQPAGERWGPPYDEDPKGEGQCKKNLANSRQYIARIPPVRLCAYCRVPRCLKSEP